MAFQQNLTDIPNGVDTLVVSFSPAFTAAPDIVIAVVQNTSGDSPKLAINAYVVEKDEEGFTVELDGTTDSTNYKLAWIAGSTEVVYQLIAVVGRRISELALYTDEPLAGDYLPFVHTSPVPVTRRVPWSVISSLFAKFVSTPPTAPEDAGAAGQWSIDEDFFYTHDGVLWGITERRTSGWGFPTAAGAVQEGRTALTIGVRTVAVTYPVAFTNPGNITFSFELTSGSGQAITGIITANSASGFTVTLNTLPDSGNYYMNWRSKERSS